MKRKVTAQVVSQRKIAQDVYELWIATDLSQEVRPGQFLGIYPKDKSMLLPRPISVCEACAQEGRLRLVYRIAGQGTREFSTYRTGDDVAVLGPLGNGFPLDAGEDKRVFLMGGGIGVPPLLELAKRLCASKQIILGYRDAQLFLAEDFARHGSLYVATEDGSAGTRGNVMDAIAQNGLTADLIYACGPMPMLRAIKRYAEEKGIPAYLSLEEHMACGVGACLGCVAKTKDVDAHSNVRNARICTDGPVFEAREVEI